MMMAMGRVKFTATVVKVRAPACVRSYEPSGASTNTSLSDYVATYETMANAKRITPTVIRHMCCGNRLHTQTHEPLLNV